MISNDLSNTKLINVLSKLFFFSFDIWKNVPLYFFFDSIDLRNLIELAMNGSDQEAQTYFNETLEVIETRAKVVFFFFVAFFFKIFQKYFLCISAFLLLFEFVLL